MGTVNVILGDGKKLNLILGQQLENAVTAVVFDFSAWQTTYGSGTLALSVQRPGDEMPYAVTLSVSGTNATWSITDLDTAYKGTGEIQLTYTVGTAKKKSVIYKFTVYESLGANGEYPSPGQTWQEEIEDELADVKQDLAELQNDSGVTAELKSALLDIASNIAYINQNGQTLYNNLYDALYPNASSISCVYTQTGIVYSSDSLDSLKDDLVVTAHYSDSTTKILKPSDYTLSGTLIAGTSTISVHYGDLVTTFTVAVTERTLTSITADYTQSGVVYDFDTLDSLKSDLVVTATYSDSSTEIVSTYTLSGTLTKGTSVITVSYGGETTTFDVIVSEKYYYDLTDGLTLLNDGIVPSAKMGIVRTYGEIILDGIGSSKRRAFPTPIQAPRCMRFTNTENPYPTDLSDTEYYPIKIPSDATGVTATISPSSQYLSLYAYRYDDTDHYTSDFITGKSQNGWIQGTGSLSFDAGDYQYLSVSSKYDNSGSSYPTDPSDVTITFTKA